MKSLNRLFGRKSARKVNRRSPFRLSRPIGYASHVERLEDRTLLASNILASLESSVNQPNDTTELVLNVGPGSSPTLGFEVRAAANSVFDPAAIQIFDANTNAVIPLDLSENDHAGTTNSLVLATLDPGEFRIEVQGQTAATGGFIVDVFLPGDADASGSVSDDEYRHALAASYQHMFGFNHVTTHALVQQLGLDPRTNFYSEEMDGDRDGDVDNNDLQLMNANRNIPAVQFELIGDQDPPQIIAGLQIDSGVSNSDGITNDLTILGNISDESLITQFKVGLDGDALVDFVDILPQVSGGANGGAFTLTRSWLETNLNGGNSLEGGTHTLSFFAQDEHDNNNADSFFDVTFELDVTVPTTGTQISNQNEDEDFGSLDLGSLTNFFNQNGGTALSFQVDSITNPIVTVDFSSGNLVLNSIQDAFGSTDIVIQAMDLAGNSVLSNLFTVDIDALNDPPVAVDDAFTTDENAVLNGGSSVFAANPTTPDSDVENDAFTVTEINGNAASVGNQIVLASGALLTLNSDGTFTYDPNNAFDSLAQGQSDTDSFTYTIDDGTGSLVTTDSATVTVTINGVNNDPVAVNDAFSTNEDVVLNGGSNVFDANPTTADSDVDNGDSFMVTEVNGSGAGVGTEITLGSGALLTLNANGTFSYNPNGVFDSLAQGQSDTDSFTYTIEDNFGGTDTATVTVTINGVNTDPDAVDDAFTTDQDTALSSESVFAANPTTADSDVDDGDSFMVTEVNGVGASVGNQITLGSGALLTLDADGTFDYDPSGAFDFLAVNETAMDSFTYTIEDGLGGTDTATVTITVNGVNDPVTANDDAVTTDRNSTINFDVRVDNVIGTVADTDPDTNDTHTVIMIDNQVVNLGDTITLAGSVAQVTLELDGTLTYDPNGEFDDLILPTDTEDDTFDYQVSDGKGSTDTATVTVTVTGTNEELMIKDGLPDISRDGLTTEVIDLTDVFKDDDPGDTISYEVLTPTLVNGDPLPAGIWVDTVSIAGVGSDELHITFTSYASEQVRLPVRITVRGTSSDGVSAPVDVSFTLTPDPQETAEVQLLSRSTAAAGRDFTYFRAQSFLARGVGIFQLVNGSQDLEYEILLSEFSPDILHTDNATTDDDLLSVRIVNAANPGLTLFTIFDSSGGDDSPAINLADSILTGTWSAGEGLTSSIIDQLYNGELVVKVEFDGNGGTSDLGGENIMVSPEVDDINDLPAGQTEFVVGENYVVEIWVKDNLAQQILAGATSETAGFFSVQLDLLWDDAAVTTAQSFSAANNSAGFFTFYDPVSINNDNIDGIRGLNVIKTDGDDRYVRLGFATFTADAETTNPVEYTVDSEGDGKLSRSATAIDFSQISISGTSVTHTLPSEFFIQTDQSNISVTGTITVPGFDPVNLVEQSGTLDTTDLSGRINLTVDDFNNPQSIKLQNSFVEINPAGESRPNRGAGGTFSDLDLADFGLEGDSLLPNVFIGLDGQLSLAIRDAIASIFSSDQAIDQNGLFDISEEWTLQNGQLDTFITLPSNGNAVLPGSNASDSTDGLPLEFFVPASAVPFGLPSWDKGRLRETSPGSGMFVLEIPISRRLSFTDSNGALVELSYEGSVTATFDSNQTDQFGDTTGDAHDTLLDSATPETKVFQGIIGNNNALADPLIDVDMFEVQLDAGDQVTVDVDAAMLGTNLDSVVRIFDSSGVQVAISDNALAPDEFLVNVGATDSFVTFTSVSGGTYFIGISAFNNSTYDATTTVGRTTGIVADDDVGSYDVTITVGDAPAPLQGTEAVVSSPDLTEGTAVEVIVVRNQTEVDSTGHVNTLPASDTWIDEWSSFWVEVYVETADAKEIVDALVDLNYNTDFFTATEIEFGRAFADNGTAVIDDASGIVTSLSGTSTIERTGSHKQALLARVKFESLGQDDVSINFEDKFIGPHALGLSLSNVNVNLADDIATNVTVSDAPETDLWAIAYDVNDDDVIDFQDLVQLVAVYGENVLDADSPYVWALDFDKSGAVNFEDLTFFVNNYGVSKGGDKDVIYPANFLQRWYGKTTDIVGDSTIDEVMDIALGMWQDALGLEQPLDIQLVITDLGGTQLGAGQITAVDDAGLPIAGIVTLDDDAAGLGWYSDVDTTAFGGTELEGGVAYTADSNSDAAGHYDLLTVLLHEIGHVAGFTRSYAPFESHIEAGVGGTLMFVGSGFEATLTDDGLHLDETVHAGDVMNATLSPGVRKLPSELDALILQTAHETATNGNFEIQVGVNAPLMANLPVVVEPLETPGSAIVSDISEQVLTTVEPFVALDPIVVEVSNSLSEFNETVLPQLDLALNRLNLKLSALDQTEIDLTVLEDLSEELQNDLYQNGLSIVGDEKFNTLADSDLDDADLDLLGLNDQLEVGFDDVFSDWTGPIL